MGEGLHFYQNLYHAHNTFKSLDGWRGILISDSVSSRFPSEEGFPDLELDLNVSTVRIDLFVYFIEIEKRWVEI